MDRKRLERPLSVGLTIGYDLLKIWISEGMADGESETRSERKTVRTLRGLGAKSKKMAALTSNFLFFRHSLPDKSPHHPHGLELDGS